MNKLTVRLSLCRRVRFVQEIAVVSRSRLLASLLASFLFVVLRPGWCLSASRVARQSISLSWFSASSQKTGQESDEGATEVVAK